MKWLLFFLFINSIAVGQHVIQGRIIDKETNNPVPFASIGIIGLPRGTSSNIDGEFSLVLPDTFTIKVTCLGYESVIIRSAADARVIILKPIATQLKEIVILNKKVDPRKIVRKAFARIRDNYNDQSFLQRFFYRQYHKTDTAYDHLIEASVDVWKQQGYNHVRSTAGENEAMRVNQLRRSLDIKGMVQGQTPISLGNILQTDIAGYQTKAQAEHLNVFGEVSNLKTDLDRYRFTFEGITTYDGQEVYEIKYKSKPDSILTTSGYIPAPIAKGTLFITTDTYAFVKTEETREDGINIYKASGYYLKHNNKYYPYHLVREGENHHTNATYFHIELMAVEISHDSKGEFTGSNLSRADLLNIPYDSTFWSSSTILKTTPLEDNIIRDLGGGSSLNKQFYLYKQYELNVTDGGKNGEEKLNWLIKDSKGKRILYLCFWNSDFKSYLVDMEYIKRLNHVYKNKILFVLVSFEEDEAKWQQLLTKYNFYSDGLINYRIGGSSPIIKSLGVKNIPAFILIANDGNVFDSDSKRPSDPLLEKDFKSLIQQGK